MLKDTDLQSLKEMLWLPWWKIFTDQISAKIKHLENKLSVFNKDLTSIEDIKYIQCELMWMKNTIELPEKLLKNKITKQSL